MELSQLQLSCKSGLNEAGNDVAGNSVGTLDAHHGGAGGNLRDGRHVVEYRLAALPAQLSTRPPGVNVKRLGDHALTSMKNASQNY